MSNQTEQRKRKAEDLPEEMQNKQRKIDEVLPATKTDPPASPNPSSMDTTNEELITNLDDLMNELEEAVRKDTNWLTIEFKDHIDLAKSALSYYNDLIKSMSEPELLLEMGISGVYGTQGAFAFKDPATRDKFLLSYRKSNEHLGPANTKAPSESRTEFFEKMAMIKEAPSTVTDSVIREAFSATPPKWIKRDINDRVKGTTNIKIAFAANTPDHALFGNHGRFLKVNDKKYRIDPYFPRTRTIWMGPLFPQLVSALKTEVIKTHLAKNFKTNIERVYAPINEFGRVHQYLEIHCKDSMSASKLASIKEMKMKNHNMQFLTLDALQAKVDTKSLLNQIITNYKKLNRSKLDHNAPNLLVLLPPMKPYKAVLLPPTKPYKTILTTTTTTTQRHPLQHNRNIIHYIKIQTQFLLKILIQNKINIQDALNIYLSGLKVLVILTHSMLTKRINFIILNYIGGPFMSIETPNINSTIFNKIKINYFIKITTNDRTIKPQTPKYARILNIKINGVSKLKFKVNQNASTELIKTEISNQLQLNKEEFTMSFKGRTI